MKSNIYTGGGDQGETSLVGGKRVAKDSVRIEAYGTVDELNSWIGLILSCQSELPEKEIPLLTKVQNTLFDIGAILACETPEEFHLTFDETEIENLEKAIDSLDASLPRHNQFILPGGTTLSSQVQIARTVARRAERRIIALVRTMDGTASLGGVLKYINRLSDYLFVLARGVNLLSGEKEIFWQKGCKTK